MHVAILAVVSSAVLHNSHSAQYLVSRIPFDLLNFTLHYVLFYKSFWRGLGVRTLPVGCVACLTRGQFSLHIVCSACTMRIILSVR
mgnify:CR=1 FL=1